MAPTLGLVLAHLDPFPLPVVIAGLIAHGTGKWRLIYWVGSALIGSAMLLVVFTFPETSYRRVTIDRGHMFAADHGRHRQHLKDTERAATAATTIEAKSADHLARHSEYTAPKSKTYLQKLALWSGTYTKEPLWKIFLRPFFLPLLPAVLWSILVFSSTIGFLVGITSNFATALSSPPYNFNTLQTSLCFIGGLVGGLLGIPAGGHFGDWIAMRATRRNDGIRQPEHRLPAI